MTSVFEIRGISPEFNLVRSSPRIRGEQQIDHNVTALLRSSVEAYHFAWPTSNESMSPQPPPLMVEPSKGAHCGESFMRLVTSVQVPPTSPSMRQEFATSAQVA